MKKYALELGYTDIHPYEVVREVSGVTLEIRMMDVEPHPDWKPEFALGGFAGHCTNQSEQQWLYHSNPDNPVIRIRLRKQGKPTRISGSWIYRGIGFTLVDSPYHYHDYNF